jgi:UDP-glucose 4-epimerase
VRVVITGGAGFIGSNLCRRMKREPGIDEILVLDDLSTGFRENLDGVGAELVVGSILDEDALRSVMAPGCAVVHLGARPSVPRSIADPVASHEANATGTLNVLEAARMVGARHVVVASSSSVYGDTDEPVKHEGLPVSPRSPYAASKLATEAYCVAWGRSYGMPTLAFRFFNVYGPRQAAGHAYAAVIPAFVDAAMQGRPLPVNGDGKQTRDFTFVDSVTEAITQAVLGTVTYDGPVNLAFGSQTDLLTLIELIEGILGHRVEVEHREPRAGDVRHSRAGSDRLRSLFPGIEPTPLEEGVRRTIAWFREEQRAG